MVEKAERFPRVTAVIKEFVELTVGDVIYCGKFTCFCV